MATQIEVALELNSLIKRSQNTTDVFIGEVISVELDTRTCTVRQITGVANDGLEYEENDTNADYFTHTNNPLIHDDIALMSGGIIDDGFLLVPKVGSQVTVMSSPRHQYFIVQYSALESYTFTSNTSHNVSVNKNSITVGKENVALTVNNGATINVTDKIKIQNEIDNLVDILSDLCLAISVLTVGCSSPGSPSSVPVNNTDFIQIGQRIKNLLN